METSMYPWGQILQATEDAYTQLDIPIGSLAICLGIVEPDGVRVLLREHRTPQTYHFSFWSPTKRKIRLL